MSAAETASEMYEKWKQEGIKYLNMADNIHSQSKETWTTKAYYWITQGQLKQAQNYLVNLRQVVQQTSNQQGAGSTAPLIYILQALVDFGNGNYTECLKNLKEVI